MRFELAVPAYNEEAIIAETVATLSHVLELLSTDVIWKITVAENGSTDRTRAEALRLKLSRVSVLSGSRRGKGLAIRSAVEKSDADVFGFIDADLSAEPSHIVSFLEKIKRGEADIVIGSRLLDKERVHRSSFRTFTSEIFNILRKLILGIDVRDSQCGLKLMNRKGMKALSESRENGWFWDLELLARARQEGLVVEEVPVEWEEFRYEDRKTKLRVLRDGLSAVAAMFRIRNRLTKEYEKRSVPTAS